MRKEKSSRFLCSVQTVSPINHCIPSRYTVLTIPHDADISPTNPLWIAALRTVAIKYSSELTQPFPLTQASCDVCSPLPSTMYPNLIHVTLLEMPKGPARWELPHRSHSGNCPLPLVLVLWQVRRNGLFRSTMDDISPRSWVDATKVLRKDLIDRIEMAKGLFQVCHGLVIAQRDLLSDSPFPRGTIVLCGQPWNQCQPSSRALRLGP